MDPWYLMFFWFLVSLVWKKGEETRFFWENLVCCGEVWGNYIILRFCVSGEIWQISDFPCGDV